jgi:pyrophosphatase PpaX
MLVNPIDVDRSNSQPVLLHPVFPWIIFDMDGTLIDTFELSLGCFNYAVGKFLKRTVTAEEALEIPGGTLEEQLGNYVPLRDTRRAAQHYRAHFHNHFSSGTRVFPGIRGLLFKLRARGVKLAVCTGADGQTAWYALVRSGLSQYFTTVVTADDVTKPKPDPEGLRIVMKIIGAHNDSTIYLGDHPNDIKASRNAGTKIAGACWGSKHNNELHKLKPDFLFKQPSEALVLSGFRICIPGS